MTDFVTAETGIRQLHARYVDAVWRKDMDAFADCFTEDAEWRIAGLVLRTRKEIDSTIRRMMSHGPPPVYLTFQAPILDVGAGVVSGRTYVTETNTLLEGKPAFSIGVYYERFVDGGDRWRFSWRLFQVHYLGPPDMSGRFFEREDFGPPPNMPPADAKSYNHTGMHAG